MYDSKFLLEVTKFFSEETVQSNDQGDVLVQFHAEEFPEIPKVEDDFRIGPYILRCVDDYTVCGQRYILGHVLPH